ncbi:MAG: ECF transporter S component [Bacillota bacterium]|nr:ECF transporter S component [Bacillota bacterium]
MKKQNLQKMIAAAMLAALCCIATLLLQIPIPLASGGYINLGDCIVLLSGWFLGPVYGCAAAAIGSFLADIFTGFLAYAPATLLIKAGMAVLAFALYRSMEQAWKKPLLARLLSALLCELLMAGGYFLYEYLLLGNGIAAAAGIPWNLLQGAAAVLLAVPLSQKLGKISNIRKWTETAEK